MNQRFATERNFENDFSGWFTDHSYPSFKRQVNEIIKLAKELACIIRDGNKSSGMLDDLTNSVIDWIGSKPKSSGYIDHGVMQWSAAVDLTLVPPTILMKTVPAPGKRKSKYYIKTNERKILEINVKYWK